MASACPHAVCQHAFRPCSTRRVSTHGGTCGHAVCPHAPGACSADFVSTPPGERLTHTWRHPRVNTRAACVDTLRVHTQVARVHTPPRVSWRCIGWGRRLAWGGPGCSNKPLDIAHDTPLQSRFTATPTPEQPRSSESGGDRPPHTRADESRPAARSLASARAHCAVRHAPEPHPLSRACPGLCARRGGARRAQPRAVGVHAACLPGARRSRAPCTGPLLEYALAHTRRPRIARGEAAGARTLEPVVRRWRHRMPCGQRDAVLPPSTTSRSAHDPPARRSLLGT